MELFGTITFDEVALSFLACFVIREFMIRMLPDTVAGPGGWLVDTEEEA
ncbi:MAG: hypothetical protein AAGF74_17315 [Pseudomonadota bacterium]